MFSASPILLDDVYAEVLQGESDAKWLQRYTTPERLAWKLPEPRNGFPAGTVATPSGNFAGYSVEPMFDPATDRSSHHWSKAAWASGEDGDEAWLAIRFPEPQAAANWRSPGTMRPDRHANSVYKHAIPIRPHGRTSMSAKTTKSESPATNCRRNHLASCGSYSPRTAAVPGDQN